MVCRPVVDQPAQALRPGENRPTGTACECLRHGGKLGEPCRDAAEIALKCFDEYGSWFNKPGGRIIAITAERIEIDLVKDHRARSNQFFALEAVDLESWRAGPVNGGKMPSNRVQAPQRPAVVVDVMAHEQSL